jgi:hypothetical protein
MAKSTRSDELFKRLRAQGLRKRTAKLISKATDSRRKPAKTMQRTLGDLKQLIVETEDRLSGGPAKRKAAAKRQPTPGDETLSDVARRPRRAHTPALKRGDRASVVASSNTVTAAGPLALHVEGKSLAHLASEPLSSGNGQT